MNLNKKRKSLIENFNLFDEKDEGVVSEEEEEKVSNDAEMARKKKKRKKDVHPMTMITTIPFISPPPPSLSHPPPPPRKEKRVIEITKGKKRDNEDDILKNIEVFNGKKRIEEERKELSRLTEKKKHGDIIGSLVEQPLTRGGAFAPKKYENKGEFNSFFRSSNKASTEDLKRDLEEELEKKLEIEVDLLEKKKNEMIPESKEEKSMEPKDKKKYQKKIDKKSGKFSKFDTYDVMDKVAEFFGSDIVDKYGNYDKNNIYFKRMREIEEERRRKYRDPIYASLKLGGKDEYFDSINSKITLEECSPSYCQKFMTRALGEQYGERLCKKKQECKVLFMFSKSPDSLEEKGSNEGFIMREFLLPSELKVWETEGLLPTFPKCCIICNRYDTTYHYKYHEEENSEPLELLQDHYNSICNDLGGGDGYPNELCLQPCANRNQKSGKRYTGIEMPIIRYDLIDYTKGIVKKPHPFKIGEFIEVECLVERVINFQIAPAAITLMEVDILGCKE